MPFFPFIVGAAVGSVVTFVAKDDPSQELLKDTTGKISGSLAGGVAALTGTVTGMFSKSEDEDVEDVVAEEVAEVTDDKKESTVAA